MNFEIMRGYSGSLAYGTNLPTSDVDIRGLICAEQKYIRTPFYNLKEIVLEEEEDGKMYELTNFFKLFAEMNPNIIELMFVDKSDLILTTDVYTFLRQEAPALLTKKVAFSFSGYAMAQLKRIKGHDKWINKPQPVEAPTQKEYMRLVHNYMAVSILKHEEFQRELTYLNDTCILLPYGNGVYAVLEDDSSPGMFNEDGSIRNVAYEAIEDGTQKRKPLMIVKYLREDHKLAKEKHTNYWTWKANRNAARHELEVSYGYDTKHAMHLVRLMRMAEEILTTGQVFVKRADAKELLDIRAGAWPLEDLLKWAEEKDELIRGKIYRDSPLPHQANLEEMSRVLMTAQDMSWSQQ